MQKKKEKGLVPTLTIERRAVLSAGSPDTDFVVRPTTQSTRPTLLARWETAAHEGSEYEMWPAHNPIPLGAQPNAAQARRSRHTATRADDAAYAAQR